MSRVAITEDFQAATSRKRSGVVGTPSGSRRASLALTDNFDSANASPLGSRKASLAVSDNVDFRGSPIGSRRASLAQSDIDIRASSPVLPQNDAAIGSSHSSRRNSAVAGSSPSDERHIMNLAVAAHEERKEREKQKQLDAAKNLKSNLLRVLVTNAVTGSLSNWSKAAKKALMLSQVDPKLTRIYIERAQLNVMFALAIMNTACICLQCASSRVLENYRDAEVARQQVSNLEKCCQSFNLTLINGACGEADSQAASTCKVDTALIVSVDTDHAVAYGTDAFWMSFYLNAAVSALSFLSVLAIFYHAHLSKKLLAFSKSLEMKQSAATNKTPTGVRLPSVVSPTFWFQIALVVVHMPPLPFDIPVLEFEHPFYTESQLLKFPWISLISALVTFRVYFILTYIRDRTIIEWSSKRRIVERKTGVNVDAVFVLKVLMSEAPMTVVGASSVTVFGILTYWMLVFERNSEWLRTFQDSLWLIVITAFTVGYGDIYPRTFPGRTISIAAGILGVIVAALGTAALSNKLSWTTAEFNVSKLLMKSVMEKKLAHQAIVYLQRTFRRISNRTPMHLCYSRETAQRMDRQKWLDTKQEFAAFKQNQDNMETLLKGILDDSVKIGTVTQFLYNSAATKEWISTVSKSGNHPLQLATSVNVLEEQLKNLQSAAEAALEKHGNLSASDKRSSGVTAKEPRVQRERVVDPRDAHVDSLLQELHSYCDILDENNKDLEWFANEINSRVRGRRRDDGPAVQSNFSALPSQNDPQYRGQLSASPLEPPQAFANSARSQFQPMNSSAQPYSHSAPEVMNAMQQQAALQMDFQTTLMSKLVAMLEAPQPSVRSRSRSRARSRHSTTTPRSRREGRSASGRSSRSRSRHDDAALSSDEEDDNAPTQAVSSTRQRKSRTSALEEGQFPADGEVWIDEDQDSFSSSLPNSVPNSRPVSAASHFAAVNAGEQPTPRMAGQSGRPQRVQRR